MIGETTKLILDRMGSNPEEFFRDSSDRWGWLFDTEVKSVLTDDERNALQAGFDNIRRKEFHHKVLETILHADRTGEAGVDRGFETAKIRSANRYVFDKIKDSTLSTTTPTKIMAPPSMIKGIAEMMQETLHKKKAEE